MKGVDTNLLVRYITQDDGAQSLLANHFFEKECSTDVPACINGTVFCELTWVLESAYDYNRQDICKVIEQILRTREFSIPDPEIIWQSLWGYQHQGADFADHYIANMNIKSGCDLTYTFDKKAAKLDHFKLLK